MQYQLAEINIATFRLPPTDPVNAEFIANLERVNALAEAAPGFVWRLVGEGNNALAIKAFANPNTGDQHVGLDRHRCAGELRIPQ